MIESKNFCCYRDNLKTVGRVFLPNKSDKRSLTPIILSHGFLANMSMCFNDAKFLANNGFACFCFDFNGGGLFSKSDGKTTNMSVLTEVEDLQTVIDYVSKQDYVNIEKLILIGYSQGGLVSTLIANKLQEKIKCLILLYPAFCIPTDAKSGHMMFAKFDPHNIPKKIKCGPIKHGRCYVDDVINFSFQKI